MRGGDTPTYVLSLRWKISLGPPNLGNLGLLQSRGFIFKVMRANLWRDELLVSRALCLSQSAALSALLLWLRSSALRLPSSGCGCSGEQHGACLPAEFSSTQGDLQQLDPFHCSLPRAQVSVQVFSILFPTLWQGVSSIGAY